MVSKELILLLTSFKPNELKRFEDFLKSPYLNTNRKLIDLFLILKSHYPLFNNPKLTKESIFHELYPSKKYFDPTLRNLFSDLNEAGESFLVLEAFSNDAFEKENILMHVLRERNLVNHFVKIIQRSYERIDNCGLSSPYFEKRYKLENNRLNFNIIYDKSNSKDIIQKRIQHISSSTKFLTLNFLMEIVDRHVKTQVYTEKYNISTQPGFISDLFKCIDFDSIPSCFEEEEYKEILTLYSCLNQLNHQSEDNDVYLNYKKTYQKCFHKLSKDERSFHNSHLINFCVSKHNDLDHSYDYAKDLIVLYKELIDNEYYKTDENQFLPSNLYRAILVTALNLEQYDWAEQFMNTNYLNIHSKDRENTINLGFFLFFGYTGQYETSLKYLNNIKLDYFVFKYDEHLMKIKVFYELGMYEEGLCALRSFIEFIHNNTFESSTRKEKYLNFTKYALKLFTRKFENNENELGFLEYHLQSVDNIIYKDWLLEKLRRECKKSHFSQKQLA